LPGFFIFSAILIRGDTFWCPPFFYYDKIRLGEMEKALIVIKEMTRLGIIKSYAIGGGIAATYYIEPVLTYDLDVSFISASKNMA